MTDISSGTVISIIIVVVIFLILREFVTWYWKLNKISDTLENIEDLLKEIKDKTSPAPPAN